MESARDLSGPIGGSTPTGPGGNLEDVIRADQL
jgi:hypothetical protein